MKKNGFTLIEILAVIVILGIIASIVALNVVKVKNDSMKELLVTKKQNLEAAAIVYGQENQDELESNCELDNEKYTFCKLVTVRELIENKFFESTETNDEGKVDLFNNVTNESMMNDKLMIYRKNNSIYAKYIENDDVVKLGYDNVKEACKNGDNLLNCVKKMDQDNNSNNTGLIKVDDDSIRYSGANPNNFICFGSDASSCPHTNLYRIIGIFKESNHGVGGELLKLVKYDYEYGFDSAGTKGAFYHYLDPGNTYKGAYSKNINGYWYSSRQKNNWDTSNLNTNNLNTSFLNSLGTWSDYIVSVSWKIGGINGADLKNSNISNIYQNEVVNSTNSVNAKVGLIYASDYAYAVDRSALNNSLSDYNLNTSLNWMYMGMLEWTISKASNTTNKVLAIDPKGNVYDKPLPSYSAVRPSFYISNSIKFKSGIGSKNDPIRIAR